jgi:hypothetical protein
LPATSGPYRSTDINGPARLVRLVPYDDIRSFDVVGCLLADGVSKKQAVTDRSTPL